MSGSTPFEPGDCDALATDPAAVIEQRVPALAGLFRTRGWHLPSAIDRVYAPRLAERRLVWKATYGFEEVVAQLDRLGGKLETLQTAMGDLTQRVLRERLLRERQVSAQLSPDARFVAWYDYGDGHWHALDLDRRREVNLTASIPHPFWEEDDDHPMLPGPYGAAGWTTADDELLVYDRFDIWAVDPEGRAAPRRVTEGYGREQGLRLRHVDLDPESEAIEAGATLLLSAFHLRTKEAGFFRDRVQGAQPPQRLVLEPKSFGGVRKAEDADVLLYTREDVAEFPDLWVADGSFGGATKVSHANPWQAEYNWATVELVEWLSTDGVPLQGLLYRPADFDPSARYPMLVNFYERSSDNLHEHAPPLPHRSIIRPTFYASRGYVVFVPDVVYRVGYPGASAMSSVMPGVLKLAAEPWIDEANVGVQGHSWGGYQIAYMLTQTDFFKAAEAGAPVATPELLPPGWTGEAAREDREARVRRRERERARRRPGSPTEAPGFRLSAAAPRACGRAEERAQHDPERGPPDGGREHRLPDLRRERQGQLPLWTRGRRGRG